MLSQPDLWDKIKRFPLHEPAEKFDFKARLIYETGWTGEFAARAIEEYKKFIYLACISQDMPFRSREIDAVWHLHILWTENYFETFCRDVVGKVIHHAPQHGVEAEPDSAFDKTLRHYDAEFSWPAPKDIWTAPRDEYKRQAPIKMIDIRRNFVIPRLAVEIPIAILFFGLTLWAISKMNRDSLTLIPFSLYFVAYYFSQRYWFTDAEKEEQERYPNYPVREDLVAFREAKKAAGDPEIPPVIDR